MATKAQQKTWLELFEAGDDNLPRGYQLKQWLFGGESISTKVAFFPFEEYTGQIVGDLFGEDSYFANTEMFWELQNKAVAAKREELLAGKWQEVIVLETGQRFNQWEHEKAPKKKGGKVFITVSPRGEVEVHEGWLTQKEARKGTGKATGKSDKTDKAARPAMTQMMENYLDLHRHASVRLALIASPSVALRLLVAHAVAASGNWTVKPDPQRSRSNQIKASVEKSPAQAAFAAEREAVTALLAMPESESSDDEQTAQVFARLLAMRDADVQRVAAYIMAETLAAGSPAVEVAGAVLKADPRSHWQTDDVFFDLIRDRATVNAMVEDVAGKSVAKGSADLKTAVQKQIIRDTLQGRNGRTKVENWLPRWMAFPFKGYGDGTCKIASRAGFVTRLLRRA